MWVSPRRIGSVLVAALVMFFGVPHGHSDTNVALAQVTTNTALQIAEGQRLVRVQSQIQRSAAPGQRLHVVAFPVIGAYGITRNLTAFGVVPVMNKRMRIDTPDGEITRGPHGLGDVRAFGRYTFLREDGPGTMLRFATFAGVEAPTGRNEDSDEFGPIPQPLQLGSGSWDPFGGLMFTYHQLQWQFDAVATFERNTTANDFQFGDRFQFDTVVKRRLLPTDLDGASWFLFGNLETNLVHRGRNQMGGQVDDDSGGTVWYISPALQFVTARFVIDAAVQIPVVQDLNGDALEDDFILTLSTRFNF